MTEIRTFGLEYLLIREIAYLALLNFSKTFLENQTCSDFESHIIFTVRQGNRR